MQSKAILFILIFVYIANAVIAQGSLSATYTFGHIPTSIAAFDPFCNGRNIILSVTLPAGDSYPVTGVDVRYNMTALSTGQMAHQRSQIKCANSNITEAAVYSGSGATIGTVNYRRNALTIANGTYAGGTRLDFEMHAWRETGSAIGACNTLTNRVDAGTWIITVYFGAQVKIPKVGVNNATPGQVFEVNGKLKLGDDIVAPTEGTVRWNSSAKDFEGYDGTQWLSLTGKTTPANSGWGSGKSVNENQGKYIAPNSGKLFGYSLDVGYDLAVVGMHQADVGLNTNQGRAYIFRKGISEWIYDTVLTASDGAPEDNFGISVSIDGDYVIVGAQNANVGAKVNQGKAYIYYRTGTIWSQQALLAARNGLALDLFGCSVSIYDDYAVVGAKGRKVGTNVEQGAAYIFLRTGTLWNEQDMLTASNGSASNNFGSCVCINGTSVIVGTPVAGQAYIFNRIGGIWSQEAILADPYQNLSFGRSVAIFGNYAVVGAPTHFAPNDNSGSGSAFIYYRTGSIWTRQALINPSDAAAGDEFGCAVSIWSDYLVVGAKDKTVGGNAWQGKAYIFKRNGTVWNQVEMLLASDGGFVDQFGFAVSIYGNNILIGAPWKTIGLGNNTFSNSGKFYYFYGQ